MASVVAVAAAATRHSQQVFHLIRLRAREAKSRDWRKILPSAHKERNRPWATQRTVSECGG